MAELPPATHLLFLKEEGLDQGLELLYLATRDLSAASEAALGEKGLSQLHYRALFFVARHPGLSFGELLLLLKMPKQSLSRLLIELQRSGFLVQRPAAHDRRQRLLDLTPTGAELERQLTEGLRTRLARAYREAGGTAVEGFRQVLTLLASPDDRRRMASMAAPGTKPGHRMAI